jgi:hypothetical protein
MAVWAEPSGEARLALFCLPPGAVLEITFGPNLRALLAGEFPPNLNPGFELPDFPPAEWGEPAGEEPPG